MLMNNNHNCQDIIAEHYIKIKPYYSIVSKDELYNADVFIFHKDLDSAVKNYFSILDAITIVIVDGDKQCIQHTNYAGLNIIHISEYLQLDQRLACIYTRHTHAPWESYGFIPLATKCNYLGIKNIALDSSMCDGVFVRAPCDTFYEENFEKIIFIYNCLKDFDSKDIFLRTIKTIATRNPTYLKESIYPQYAHPKVKAMSNDIVLEGGLDSGLTTKKFAEDIGANGKIFGFEPVENGYITALQTTKHFSNVYL